MKIMPSSINFSANKMSNKQAHYFEQRLKNSKHVDIVCHASTDRDSLNSAIAMQRYLDNLSVNSRIIVSQELNKIGVMKPDFKYIQADEIKPDSTPKDTVLCVDFSAKERVNPNVLKYINKADNILCIDHHEGVNLFKDNYITIKKPMEDTYKVINSTVPCYIDTSAKSATSIIYRMFEALRQPVSNTQAYSLMFGLVDDGAKKGYFVCDGKNGTITPTTKLVNDENAFDVYNKLNEKINDEQRKKIAKAIDIISNLTDEERAFQKSLYDKIKLSKNKKIAYIEIPPDDPEWTKLGSDNARTSKILNRFRQAILNNEYHDEKLNDVVLALTFYEAEGNYRISAHSKEPSLLDFYKYIEDTKIPDFTKNAGGHSERGGGRIRTTNKKTCHKWVKDIVSCDEFYDL